MNLDQFVAWATGQSLLYPPNSEAYRGQCYQLINFYIAKVWGSPIIWRSYAYQLLEGASQYPNYQVTINNPNDPNQVPPVGAVMVFNSSLPGSGGMGHTDIFLQATGVNSWIGFDSNWGGKTAHKVTHNYSYVAGWITLKGGMGAGPVANTGENEMIANEDQAVKLYKMLRPNGGGNGDEISQTAGRRSYANFVNDAQNEVAQRDANLVAQAQQMANMQQTINMLNEAVTAATSNDEMDRQRIAELTAELTTTHDKIADLQKSLPTPTTTQNPKPEKQADAIPRPSFITRFLAFLLTRKKK